jgi:tRNA A37 N6-isopentenylltransferase MiaA
MFEDGAPRTAGQSARLPPLIVIAGPTAVGKTAAAIALARALGGRGAEIVAYLRGETTLGEAIDRIRANTHRYVRHQETWLRRNRALERLDVADEGWQARLLARAREWL